MTAELKFARAHRRIRCSMRSSDLLNERSATVASWRVPSPVAPQLFHRLPPRMRIARRFRCRSAARQAVKTTPKDAVENMSAIHAIIGSLALSRNPSRNMPASGSAAPTGQWRRSLTRQWVRDVVPWKKPARLAPTLAKPKRSLATENGAGCPVGEARDAAAKAESLRIARRSSDSLSRPSARPRLVLNQPERPGAVAAEAFSELPPAPGTEEARTPRGARVSSLAPGIAKAPIVVLQ